MHAYYLEVIKLVSEGVPNVSVLNIRQKTKKLQKQKWSGKGLYFNVRNHNENLVKV